MRIFSKYITLIFSTLTVFLFNEDISHGYEYGPIIDRLIIYLAPYKFFPLSHANASKIKFDLAHDIPYPNVPQYPLGDRNVPFYLYTRKNPEVPEILYVGDSRERLLKAGFDPSRDTALFAHGYITSYQAYASNFTTYLLPRKDINIIFIVWDSYSYFDVTYTEAVTLFKLGEVIARFVQTLIDAGANRKNMNLFGDSDGAAAVALAAKRIYPRVGRLTGKCAEFIVPTNIRL